MNYHAIEIKYLGATNTKGSRIKIYSHRFQQSKIIPYNYEFNGTLDGAKDWLTNNGFNLVGQAETKDGYILFSDTFKGLKS